jgi:PAS domain S-box-containing protein
VGPNGLVIFSPAGSLILRQRAFLARDGMMEVEYSTDHLDASRIMAALLDEFSAVTDYRTLRDNLPRRLARLLRCRCVLLYQRMGETLQFASGSFADQPGWSAALLAVAHINPIELDGDIPEAQAWRARHAITAPQATGEDGLVCTPLIYRQRAIGILTAIRGTPETVQPAETGGIPRPGTTGWSAAEVALVAVTANIVAMLLENTRLLERDRERIHELSLLNGITSQMNCSLHERERVARIVVQRAREVSTADLCAFLTPGSPPDAVTWIPPELHRLLLQRWLRNLPLAPLVLERAGEGQNSDYMDYLGPHIKTFFALPLVGKRDGDRVRGGLPFIPPTPRAGEEQGTRVFGVIVGAYHKTWKLRRAELVLLQVLANQASAVLENIALMEDVVAARNEARDLLRQVLDDQRLKELILESIPSGLITIDMHGQMTTFNRAAETVLGYHPREVLGQPVRKVLDLRSLTTLQQTGQAQHETLLTSGQQGQEIALDMTLVPLRDDRGEQMGALATFADITTIHHLEEEKRRLDRLASLGEMSANVAHEVRNPLAAIKTSMQMLLDDLKEPGALQENGGTQDAIVVVLKEVGRLDSIVRDLLLFARPRQLHLVECDLMELSARILHFLQPQCDERGVRVHLLHQDAPTALVDVAQMEQVLMNIFLNALQAMPDGGILTLACQTLQLPAWESNTIRHASNPLLAHTDLLAESDGDGQNEQSTPDRSKQAEQDPWNQRAWLDLTVSDTGVGISQEALERVFQPFYTTKAHGIGLGLPITRRLIEDHHGYILVESQLGYGTTVSVRLPLGATTLEEEKLHREGGIKHRGFDDSDC